MNILLNKDIYKKKKNILCHTNLHTKFQKYPSIFLRIQSKCKCVSFLGKAGVRVKIIREYPRNAQKSVIPANLKQKPPR